MFLSYFELQLSRFHYFISLRIMTLRIMIFLLSLSL